MSLQFQDSYREWKLKHPDAPPPKVIPNKKVVAKAMPVMTKKKDPLKPWTWKSTDTHGFKTRADWRKSMRALGKHTEGGF